MDVLSLRETPPREAVFDVPDKSIPMRRVTTLFPPLNSDSAVMTSTSGQTKIEFDLSSTGMIDPYGCYLNFDITPAIPKTPVVGTSGITARNKFMGATSVIDMIEIIASDGTLIERVDYYNNLTDFMTKASLTEDYLKSTGSILFGIKTTETNVGNNTYDVTSAVPTANYPVATVTGSGVDQKYVSMGTLSFSFPLTNIGFFSSNSGKYFPLNAVNNGVRLRIYLSPPRRVFQCKVMRLQVIHYLMSASQWI